MSSSRGFTGKPVFTLNPKASAVDVRERLFARLSHLQALLSITYGEAAAGFNAMDEGMRDDYLWLCGLLAEECGELAAELPRKEIVVAAAQ